MISKGIVYVQLIVRQFAWKLTIKKSASIIVYNASYGGKGYKFDAWQVKQISIYLSFSNQNYFNWISKYKWNHMYVTQRAALQL